MRPFDALKFVHAKFPVAPQHYDVGDPWRHKRKDERDHDDAASAGKKRPEFPRRETNHLRSRLVGRVRSFARGLSGRDGGCSLDETAPVTEFRAAGTTFPAEHETGQSAFFVSQRRGETQNGLAEPERDGWWGDVDVISRKQLLECPHWKNAFASQHKDRRYYEIVEDTIHPEFEYLYFAFYDRQGAARAIQPFFILDLDILGGLRARFGKLIDAVRRRWPRFMYLRTMMVGCVAGEGHIDGDDETTRAAIGRLLARSIVRHARMRRAQLIVLKEFPRRYRAALTPFVRSGFARIPSMPQTQLNVAFDSFDDYMRRALKSDTRRKLLKKFKIAELGPPIEMSVVADIEPIIDEIYDLYRHVYERSTLRFEHLTKEYFRRLSVTMADRSRFFLWRRNDKIVAFCNCMEQQGTLFVEYLGLDYNIALNLHLYHYAFHDIVRWAITNRYELIQNGSLNYDPKLHFRHRLDPLDLYVKHTSRILNAALRLALPWLEPTRYDRTLRKFPNYIELWD